MKPAPPVTRIVAMNNSFEFRDDSAGKNNLVRANHAEGYDDRLKETFRVQPQRPVVDVFHFKLHAPLERERLTPRGNPEASHPGPDAQDLVARVAEFLKFQFR